MIFNPSDVPTDEFLTIQHKDLISSLCKTDPDTLYLRSIIVNKEKNEGKVNLKQFL